MVDRAATVEAFSAFYRESIRPLIAHLITTGVSPTTAADIAQECMTELFRRWDDVEHPRAYVYVSAGRMWVRRVASLQKEAPVGELPEPTSLVPNPDELEEFETRHRVLQALKTLPPRQRQVLSLTFQSFTPTEIGEQLGLEPATVRAHLMRARRAVADYFKDVKDGEGEQWPTSGT
ncbi:sigma-70 family RNA polymerase sigma factor [Streptomyces sp. NPDC046909]|uniref:RNA polymerase sigma factor n=1 Tax=Streptomyces sp. NPDC046909 TaxID=3155617 RepID=UPI0033FD6E1C